MTMWLKCRIIMQRDTEIRFYILLATKHVIPVKDDIVVEN